MFTRVSWGQLLHSTTVEQAMTHYRQRIQPALLEQAGFLGSVVLADVGSKEVVSATYWQTAEARDATETLAEAARTQTGQAMSAESIDTDRFEVILQDRTAPARVGTFARLNDMHLPPAHIDAMVGYLRDTAIPVARSQHGYRSSRMSANRESGRVLVSTVWDTAADRDTSEAAMAGLRRQGVEVAGASPQVQIKLYEVVYVDLTEMVQRGP
jgi:heme-degrading monooxygenase HmoA